MKKKLLYAIDKITNLISDLEIYDDDIDHLIYRNELSHEDLKHLQAGIEILHDFLGEISGPLLEAGYGGDQVVLVNNIADVLNYAHQQAEIMADGSKIGRRLISLFRQNPDRVRIHREMEEKRQEQMKLIEKVLKINEEIEELEKKDAEISGPFPWADQIDEKMMQELSEV